MDQNFEQDIPLPAIIIGFVILMILSQLLRKKLRQRSLVRQGQLLAKEGRVPTVKERLAGNPVWASGEIVSKGRNLMLMIWLVTVVLNLTFGVSFIKSLSNPEMKTGPIIMLGIFSLFGIGFAAYAVRVTMRYLRFGESRCRIEGKAGVLGETMSGVIRNNNKIEVTGDYNIELQCLEFYETGTEKNRRTETRVHWQSKQQVPYSGKSTKSGIPFSFALPKYPPETGYQVARGNISWQLTISAPVKGVDYSALFVVPVFKVD